MKNVELPSRDEALEMIMHLDAPFQTMAWIMLETGAKFSAVQTIRIREVQIERGRLIIDGQTFQLSIGLIESIHAYIATILRPGFEQLKRKSHSMSFSAQRLFPAWIMDGFEHMDLEAVMPLADFVNALQSAAKRSGCRRLVNSNTLRLVAAREWLKQGMKMDDLHQRLGHRDLMTTMLLAQTLRHGGLTFAAAA